MWGWLGCDFCFFFAIKSGGGGRRFDKRTATPVPCTTNSQKKKKIPPLFRHSPPLPPCSCLQDVHPPPPRKKNFISTTTTRTTSKLLHDLTAQVEKKKRKFLPLFLIWRSAESHFFFGRPGRKRPLPLLVSVSAYIYTGKKKFFSPSPSPPFSTQPAISLACI